MAQPLLTSKTGPHFAVADLGLFSQLDQFTFEALGNPVKLEGKVFLKQILNLTSAEISLNHLPPGKSVPFSHKHRLNEEIYIFVRGQGEFQVDDCVFPLSEGTVVRVAPEGERCMSQPQSGRRPRLQALLDLTTLEKVGFVPGV